MEHFGHIQNGIVVLDSGIVLPEGSRVSVSPIPSEPQPEKQQVDFPLVRDGLPDTWKLTNEMIAQIIEEEDIESMKGKWNVPS